MSLASDCYCEVGNDTIQQLATEAYLRGLKDVAIRLKPKNMQEAGVMVKDTIANSKAIFGSRVTFKERLFTYEEEKRVSSIENKVDKLCNVVLGKRQSTPYPRNRSPSLETYRSYRP